MFYRPIYTCIVSKTFVFVPNNGGDGDIIVYENFSGGVWENKRSPGRCGDTVYVYNNNYYYCYRYILYFVKEENRRFISHISQRPSFVRYVRGNE